MNRTLVVIVQIKTCMNKICSAVLYFDRAIERDKHKFNAYSYSSRSHKVPRNKIIKYPFQNKTFPRVS